MNNLLSSCQCRLVYARIIASEKDLPVKVLLDSNVIGVLRVPSKSPSSISFTMSREPSGIKDKNSLVSLLILIRAYRYQRTVWCVSFFLKLNKDQVYN